MMPDTATHQGFRIVWSDRPGFARSRSSGEVTGDQMLGRLARPVFERRLAPHATLLRDQATT
jgi:hypothetical protein